MIFYDFLWCSMMFYDVLWCSMVFYDDLWCSMIRTFLVSFCRSVPTEFLRSFFIPFFFLTKGRGLHHKFLLWRLSQEIHPPGAGRMYFLTRSSLRKKTFPQNCWFRKPESLTRWYLSNYLSNFLVLLFSTIRCSVPHPPQSIPSRQFNPIRPLIAPRCYIHL